MSTRVCSRCRRPLPVPPSDGSAAAPCPFCAAADGAARASDPAAARAGQPRSTSSLASPGMTQSAPPPARRAPPPAPGAPSAADPARRPDPRDDPSVGKKRSEAFASALVETARTTPVHSFAVPPEAIPLVNQPRRRTPPPAPPAAAAAPVAATAAPSPRRATATLASLGPAAATVPAAAPVRAVAPAAAAAPAPLPAVALAPMYAPASAIVHGGSASPAMAAVATAPARAPAPAPAVVAAPAPVLVSVPPMGGTTPPPASAASSARGADAWNIGSYLEDPVQVAPPVLAAPPISEPAPMAEVEVAVDLPVDTELRGALATMLDRLPARRVGIVLGCAALVAALGVGGFKLLGGSRPRGVEVAGRAGTRAAAVVAAAAPKSSPALPALVMPKITADPAPAPAPPSEAPPAPERAAAAKPRAREPAAEAPSAPVAHEEHRASPAPKNHARAEKTKPAKSVAKSVAKSAAKPAKHAERKVAAAPARARAHRRVTAHASAPVRETSDESETDRMARARDAYRQGNQRLFSGDAAGAITAYEEMVRLNPKDPAGYRGLGLANAQLGKRTEAVRYLRAYLKHAPSAEDRAIITSRISLLQTLP